MKKKFKDTKVGQFLIGKNGLFKNLGDVIPTKGLLSVVKNLISKDDSLPIQDKETALKLLEIDSTVIIGAYFGSRGLEKYKKISR